MSERVFPPYTHIPGSTPHPLRDPAGHMYPEGHDTSGPQQQSMEGVPRSLQAVIACEAFQWGVALFNAGYYWESHEVWESLWHAVGRSGPLADFLKGMIKLAAAGVKLREQNADGVHRHALRARALFEGIDCSTSWEDSGGPLKTVVVTDLVSRLAVWSHRLAESPPPFAHDRTGSPVPILGILPITSADQMVDRGEQAEK